MDGGNSEVSVISEVKLSSQRQEMSCISAITH